MHHQNCRYADRVFRLLERVEYRRADSTEDKRAIFRMRHDAYMRAGTVQPALAHRGEPLPALPEGERLLERATAGLEPAYDVGQLVARLLVPQVLVVGHVAHPNQPRRLGP